MTEWLNGHDAKLNKNMLKTTTKTAVEMGFVRGANPKKQTTEETHFEIHPRIDSDSEVRDRFLCAYAM